MVGVLKMIVRGLARTSCHIGTPCLAYNVQVSQVGIIDDIIFFVDF